jgi:hypothetical protein
VLAAAPLAVEADGGSASILHGPPSWHLDVLLMALAVFLAAVALAWKLYGKGAARRGPDVQDGLPLVGAGEQVLARQLRLPRHRRPGP